MDLSDLLESFILTPNGLVSEQGGGTGNETSGGGGPSGAINMGLKEGSPAASEVSPESSGSAGFHGSKQGDFFIQVHTHTKQAL